MSKKTKDITPQQYADLKGWSAQYVHRLLGKGENNKLPFVLKVNKFGRFYTLEVPENLNADSFKNN